MYSANHYFDDVINITTLYCVTRHDGVRILFFVLGVMFEKTKILKHHTVTI